jgi:hypothetical protein
MQEISLKKRQVLENSKIYSGSATLHQESHDNLLAKTRVTIYQHYLCETWQLSYTEQHKHQKSMIFHCSHLLNGILCKQIEVNNVEMSHGVWDIKIKPKK